MPDKNVKVTLQDEEFWPWDSQVSQYPLHGEPGISYYRGDHFGMSIHCLLYRNIEGDILGILNYYPQDMYAEGSLVMLNPEPRRLMERKGNVKIWTHPNFQRRGIASELLRAAMPRWGPIDLFNQQYVTRQGAEFINGFLAKNSALNGAHSKLDMEELETRL